MQHEEKKCKKCGGFVVGRDAIYAMVSGLCAHCQRKGMAHPKKTEEQKRLEASHRAARLADRRMKNQARKTAAGRKGK